MNLRIDVLSVLASAARALTVRDIVLRLVRDDPSSAQVRSRLSDLLRDGLVS